MLIMKVSYTDDCSFQELNSNDMFMLVRKQHTTNKSDASYILYIVLKFLPTESELCYKMHII